MYKSTIFVGKLYIKNDFNDNLVRLPLKKSAHALTAERITEGLCFDVLYEINIFRQYMYRYTVCQKK